MCNFSPFKSIPRLMSLTNSRYGGIGCTSWNYYFLCAFWNKLLKLMYGNKKYCIFAV